MKTSYLAFLLLIMHGCNEKHSNERQVGSSAVRKLIDLPGAESRPSFSPDGKRMLFYSDTDGPNNIYITELEEVMPISIAPPENRNSFAMWSPDGKHITYTSSIDGNQKINMYSVDSG